MQRSKRLKRASEQDLYRSCALGGDCIEDVKNKVEGRTLADILLKIFGSVLYLGNLGIGTGRGTGGQFGYGSLGGSTRPAISQAPVRPSIPLDPVGPIDVLPIDPTAPAIVPLSEGIPDVAVIDTPGAGPGLPSETIDVTTVIDELSEVTGVGEHPNVTYNTTDAAQIDIQVQPPPPTKIVLDSATYNTDANILTHASHVDSDYTVFVDAQMHGISVGSVEYIELQEINLRESFEIDEGPVESTPLSERFINRARDLYNRYTTQVPTRQVLNVTSPRVFYEFENPAFDTDTGVTNVFQREVQALAESTDLQGTVTLSDIRFGESANRTVRVSRVGQRLGMTTRSGLQISERVHFYYDISPIPTNNIELQTFGEFSNESTVVDELTTTSFINMFEQPIQGSLQFSDEVLLDDYAESFNNSHLIVTATDTDNETFNIPLFSPASNIKVFVNDIGKDIFVYHPSNDNIPIHMPSTSFTPLHPSFSLDIQGASYDIHPSLLRRKRKRSFS